MQQPAPRITAVTALQRLTPNSEPDKSKTWPEPRRPDADSDDLDPIENDVLHKDCVEMTRNYLERLIVPEDMLPQLETLYYQTSLR